MKTLLSALLIALFYICPAQVNLSNGLIAYYPFNGNANDASGNNNNGIVTNATLTVDRFNQANSAYYFNGTNAFIRVPHSPSLALGNQISIAAYVKVQGFYNGACHGNTIVDKVGAVDNNPGGFVLRYDDSYYYNYQNCGSTTADPNHQNFYAFGAQPLSGTPTWISTEVWYSVIYTNDGTTAKIFVNGVQQVANPYSQSFNNTNDMYFGKHNSASNPYFMTGIMDDIRIYNRALNSSEIGFLAGIPSTSMGVGIGTTTPTAMLHVVGNVKLDSLPKGGGSYLVLGANNQVMVSQSGGVGTKNSNADSDIESKILLLQAEIEALKKEIIVLKNIIQL